MTLYLPVRVPDHMLDILSVGVHHTDTLIFILLIH